ncbi:MAG: PDZ domain-containing protein [Rhodothermales bacterium]
MTERTHSHHPKSTLQLSGWSLWLARALLTLIVVSGVALNIRAIPLYFELINEAEPPFQSIHVNARWRTAGVPVVPQTGGVAEKAGLRDGLLLAVNGQWLQPTDNIINAARLIKGPIGEPVNLTVIAFRGGDTLNVSIVRTDALAPEFEEAGMSWHAFSLFADVMSLLSRLVFFLAGAVLLLRTGRALVAVAGATAFWAFAARTPMIENMRQVVDLPVVLAGMLEYIYIALALGLTAFLLTFPDGRVRPRWAWWLLLPFGLIAANRAIGSGLGIVVVVIWFAVGISAQIVRYRSLSSPEQRLQTKWAMLGVLMGMGFLIAGFLLSKIPRPAGSTWYWWLWILSELLTFMAIVFPIGVVLSLLRYRLWDVESVWSRSAAIGALTIALTATVAGLTALAQSVFGAGGPLSLGIATAAAVALFVPLENRLSEWADRRFLSGLHNLRERLPALVDHLRETESIGGIGHAVVNRVSDAVHATRAAILMPDGERAWKTVAASGIGDSDSSDWIRRNVATLAGAPATPKRKWQTQSLRTQSWRAQSWRDLVAQDPADPVFPVRVALSSEKADGEQAVEGWLVLGPRPDGSGYGLDDLEAVAGIAGSVGRALQVVRMRESRAAAQQAAVQEERRELRQIRSEMDSALAEVRRELAAIRKRLDDRDQET